jgi:NAD+ kinase
MKVAIVSEKPEEVIELLSLHKNFFEVTDKNPEVVISYGGDGTLMKAEYLYPGIPKLYLKNSRIAKLGHQTKENKEIVDHLVRGEYKIEEVMKLEAQVKGEILIGLNDIVIHNENPRHGIRYIIQIDDVPLRSEIIGDGVVFATPLGSTGYYRSITDSSFEIGIGLAFNNSTEQSDHMVLRDTRIIRIQITRGPATCYADNQEKSVTLHEGEFIDVKKSDQVGRIIRV